MSRPARSSKNRKGPLEDAPQPDLIPMDEPDDDPVSNRPRHWVQPSRLRVGEIVGFSFYGRITALDLTDPEEPRIEVKDLDTGDELVFAGQHVLVHAASADQVVETRPVNQTQMLEILTTTFHTPMTCEFVRQDGKRRVMRFRMVGPEPLRGRSRVEDLEQPPGRRLRLIDHRTLQWLVVNGVKYVLR